MIGLFSLLVIKYNIIPDGVTLQRGEREGKQKCWLDVLHCHRIFQILSLIGLKSCKNG